jgi:hypothetical protein
MPTFPPNISRYLSSLSHALPTSSILIWSKN